MLTPSGEPARVVIAPSVDYTLQHAPPPTIRRSPTRRRAEGETDEDEGVAGEDPEAPVTSSSLHRTRPCDELVARAIASISSPAIAKRIADSSIGGTAPTPSLPAVQLPLQQSAAVT